ncbi:MAG: hypothetical protein KC680_01955 [Candidatus Peregrinibacteria bacterium]|nr:hypothetical protein [Candidatus Peregrinibacteria bacterium]
MACVHAKVEVLFVISPYIIMFDDMETGPAMTPAEGGEAMPAPEAPAAPESAPIPEGGDMPAPETPETPEAPAA